MIIFFTALAVALFYTRKYWTVRPSTWFQSYLLFTIIIYSYRWLFQWGTPQTTLYEADAPGPVRITKDLVFIAFILICAFRNKFKSSPLIWSVLPFVVWLCICNYIRLLYFHDSHGVLFYWRSSLEYIPLAFLYLDERIEELTRFIAGCCWIIVGFLGLEIFSGRLAGFAQGGLLTRYGSVFGSPNDLGMFAVLVLLAICVFSDQIARSMRLTLIPAFSIMLILAGSRSAILGLLSGLISIWPKSKRWLLVIGVLAFVFYGSLIAVFRNAKFVDDLLFRLGDASAMTRVTEFAEVRAEVQDWGISEMLVGSRQLLARENFYLAVLLRAGFIGALLFVGVAVFTWRRARHPFLRASITAILVASAFVPYPDVFPTTVYFWLLVGLVWRIQGQKIAHSPRAATGLMMPDLSSRIEWQE